MTASSAPARYGKGTTRKQLKARKVRLDNAEQRKVRDHIFEREDYACAVVTRLPNIEMLEVFAAFGPCRGPLDPAHMGDHKRSATRNQAPDVRHHSSHELALCRHHHECVDFDTLRFDPLTKKGMDGRISYFIASPKSVRTSGARD